VGWTSAQRPNAHATPDGNRNEAAPPARLRRRGIDGAVRRVFLGVASMGVGEHKAGCERDQKTRDEAVLGRVSCARRLLMVFKKSSPPSPPPRTGAASVAPPGRISAPMAAATLRSDGSDEPDSSILMIPAADSLEEYGLSFDRATHGSETLALENLDGGTVEGLAELVGPTTVDAVSPEDSGLMSDFRPPGGPKQEPLTVDLEAMPSTPENRAAADRFGKIGKGAEVQSDGFFAIQLASTAVEELRSGGASSPIAGSMPQGGTGSHAVVDLPSGQRSSELPVAHVDRHAPRGPSPSPQPAKEGLFGADLWTNGMVAAGLGLLLCLYPAHEASRRMLRDSVDARLVELEDSIDSPLAVLQGDLREPKTIAAEIRKAEERVDRHFYLVWLGSGLPLGLVLAFIRRRRMNRHD